MNYDEAICGKVQNRGYKAGILIKIDPGELIYTNDDFEGSLSSTTELLFLLFLSLVLVWMLNFLDILYTRIILFYALCLLLFFSRFKPVNWMC